MGLMKKQRCLYIAFCISSKTDFEIRNANDEIRGF